MANGYAYTHGWFRFIRMEWCHMTTVVRKISASYAESDDVICRLGTLIEGVH